MAAIAKFGSIGDVLFIAATLWIVNIAPEKYVVPPFDKRQGSLRTPKTNLPQPDASGLISRHFQDFERDFESGIGFWSARDWKPAHHHRIKSHKISPAVFRGGAPDFALPICRNISGLSRVSQGHVAQSRACNTRRNPEPEARGPRLSKRAAHRTQRECRQGQRLLRLNCRHQAARLFGFGLTRRLVLKSQLQ